MKIQDGIKCYTTAIMTDGGDEVEVCGFFTSNDDANIWANMIDALYEPEEVEHVGTTEELDAETFMEWLDIVDGERKLDS